MSYTIQPHEREESRASTACTQSQPISLRRIAIAVSLGSVVIISLAGLPSFSRHPRLQERYAHACWGALMTSFAEFNGGHASNDFTLRQPFTVEQLRAHLQPLDVWKRAVLSMHGVSATEISAAGLHDRRVCEALALRQPRPDEHRWTLVLLDEKDVVVGQLKLQVPPAMLAPKSSVAATEASGAPSDAAPSVGPDPAPASASESAPGVAAVSAPSAAPAASSGDVTTDAQATPSQATPSLVDWPRVLVITREGPNS